MCDSFEIFTNVDKGYIAIIGAISKLKPSPTTHLPDSTVSLFRALSFESKKFSVLLVAAVL